MERNRLRAYFDQFRMANVTPSRRFDDLVTLRIGSSDTGVGAKTTISETLPTCTLGYTLTLVSLV